MVAPPLKKSLWCAIEVAPCLGRVFLLLRGVGLWDARC